MERTKFLHKKTFPYIIPSDYPDPDVIRVGNVFYMVSTTMHFFPGCVILRSYNLVDWEFASYVFTRLEENPTEKQTLADNKGIYGKGMWAATVRFHAGTFYVLFVANDTHKTYLFTSKKINGTWKRHSIKGFYHDASLLFDDDGRIYLTHGNTDIYLTELKSDLSAPKEGGINKIIIRDNKDAVNLGYEGSHFYKIDGKYYVFLINIPKGKMRTQSCFVCNTIDGEYKGREVLCCDVDSWQSGAAQGGIVQNTDGKWYAVLFQDHGALGRIPVLVAVSFKEEDDIPFFSTIAKDGKETLPALRVWDNNPNYTYKPLFENGFTAPCWQFNHVPNKKFVRVHKNRFCITTDKVCTNVVQATNTLTTRTFGEKCGATVFLDASHIGEGDTAGFCALQGEYGFIGITKKAGLFYLQCSEHKSEYSPWDMGVFDSENANTIEETLLTATDIKRLELKMDFDLTREGQTVAFSYLDKSKNRFVPFGSAVHLRFTLDHFVGVRFALFCFSTIKKGGKASFTDFRFYRE